MDDIWECSFFVMFVLAAIMLLMILSCTFSSSGKVDYCYFEQNTYSGKVIYEVHGHRNWRPDSKISVEDSLSGAIASAQSINCPINGAQDEKQAH